MSYYETVQGMGRLGFSEGMGAAFPVGRGTPPNEGLRAIQQGLQRSGDLPPGTGPTGADGLWGFHTITALGLARTRLGRTAAAFSMTNAGRTVNIPDDFIAAIQGAPPAAVPTLPPGPDPSTTPPPPAPPPGHIVLATEAMPLPPVVEPPSHTRMYLMIGGGVAVVGGVAAYFLLRAKKPTPNRRTRRGQRRRTSR